MKQRFLVPAIEVHLASKTLQSNTASHFAFEAEVAADSPLLAWISKCAGEYDQVYFTRFSTTAPNNEDGRWIRAPWLDQPEQAK